MPDGRYDESNRLSEWLFSPEPARVKTIHSRTANEVFFALSLAEDRKLGHQPGQFVQVSAFGYGEAPISVCSSPTRQQSFELCVRPAGNVSRRLHELEAGDWVGIRGPYGKGFPVQHMKGHDILILAGGIGLAPLRSVINYISDHRNEYGRLAVIYGARNPSMILFRRDIEAWLNDSSIELYLTVDHPDKEWKGRTGVLTGPLRELEIDPRSTLAAVVGPPVMFRFVAAELLQKGFSTEDIYVSLERRFKCGIGKCGHCQLNDVYVCQDGPVFSYADLLQRTEAVEAWAPEKEQD